MEKDEGKEYSDLERIKKDREAHNLDIERTEALSTYCGIHANRHDDRELYLRKLRDIVGHGNALGLTDSYPTILICDWRLFEIEKKMCAWHID